MEPDRTDEDDENLEAPDDANRRSRSTDPMDEPDHPHGKPGTTEYDAVEQERKVDVADDY